MEKKTVDNINMSNAKIIFRNFSGKEGPFNQKGKRNFSVVIDDPRFADQLTADGWNIKLLKPKDIDDQPSHHLPVAVAYENYPPKIYMITGNKRTLLDEESVNTLDFAEISNVDLIIKPYCYEVNGKSGVKAYVKTMYVTIEQDEFEKKYSSMEDEDLPF